MAIPDLSKDPRFLEETLAAAATDRDQAGVESAFRLLLQIDPARALAALERAGLVPI